MPRDAGTALGGDNRAGAAVVLTALAEIVKRIAVMRGLIEDPQKEPEPEPVGQATEADRDAAHG